MLLLHQVVGQEDGLTVGGICEDEAGFRLGIAPFVQQAVAVLVEVDETHFEEGQTQDFVFTGRVADDVLRQKFLDIAILDSGNWSLYF